MLSIVTILTGLKKKLSKSPNFKNAYWSIVDVLVYPLLLLISTPFFLKELGAELYGVWMLINSFIISIGVLNAGMGDATIKFISKYKALNDKEGIQKVFSATYSITIAVALFAAILILISAAPIINTNLFEIQHSYREEAITALTLASVLFAIRLIEQIFFSYFKAIERFDIFSIFSTVNKSLALILSVILVLAGYSLVAIFIAHILINFISLLIEAIVTAKYLGWKVFIPKFKKSDISEVFNFSVWAWGQTVVGIVGAQLDRYIVAATVSMTGLAYYSIGLLVANQIHIVFSAASSFLFPLISKKIEASQEVSHFYFKMQLLIIGTGLVTIVGITVLQDPLFTIWLGEDSYLKSKDFITLFLCFEALLITSIVPYFYLIGSGYIKLNTLLLGSRTIVSIIAMLVLFQLQGPEGLVWGKILAVAAISPFLYNILHRKVLSDFDSLIGLKLLLPSFAIISFILFQSIILKLFSLIFCAFSLYMFVYKGISSLKRNRITYS